jgi:tRNA-Thr(GGU) m(6)t(6)A37 methyltransferase TsaA
VQLEHFSEIREFSHIWVLFVFHENTNADSQGVSVAKIRPPRLYGKKVGCLSTRSPHRPNNIGLSVCSVESVGSDYIELSGIDMVDGTPVLDVKPYIPYDIIPSDLSLPMAVSASGTPYLSKKLTVPTWIVDADIVMTPVSFESSAIEALHDIARDRMLSNYASAEEALEFITQVLYCKRASLFGRLISIIYLLPEYVLPELLLPELLLPDLLLADLLLPTECVQPYCKSPFYDEKLICIHGHVAYS